MPFEGVRMGEDCDELLKTRTMGEVTYLLA